MDPAGVFMKTVEAPFVPHPEEDQHAANEADGQPRDVDRRVRFFPGEVADGGFQIALEPLAGRR